MKIGSFGAAILLIGLAGSSSANDEHVQSRHMTKESASSYLHIFHDDTVCDRNAYTSFKISLNRGQRHKTLKATREHAAVPNQRTRVCPRVVKDLGSSTTSTVYGYDTTWFLKNEASTPVVVALVKDGMEFSAMNDKISPPQADPSAIVQPGGTKVIHTFEGHVFSVRSVYEDGSTGNILLQHRAGLIPIGAHTQQLACPSTDPEPVIEVANEQEIKLVTHPDFARRLGAPLLKPCNLLEIGFRNLATCPLHAYWVRPGTGNETFTFHLGMNHHANDFHWDWDSATKFEASFVGHEFVFRSAFSAREVERITILPTIITDCPALDEQVYEITYGLNLIERVVGLEVINSTKRTDALLFSTHNKTADLYGISGNIYSV